MYIYIYMHHFVDQVLFDDSWRIAAYYSAFVGHFQDVYFMQCPSGPDLTQTDYDYHTC